MLYMKHDDKTSTIHQSKNSLFFSKKCSKIGQVFQWIKNIHYQFSWVKILADDEFNCNRPSSTNLCSSSFKMIAAYYQFTWVFDWKNCSSVLTHNQMSSIKMNCLEPCHIIIVAIISTYHTPIRSFADNAFLVGKYQKAKLRYKFINIVTLKVIQTCALFLLILAYITQWII